MGAATGSKRESRRPTIPPLMPSRIAFFRWAIKEGREPEFLTYRNERLSRPDFGVVLSDMIRPVEHNQSDANDSTRWTTFQSVTIFRDTPASPFDPGAFFDDSAPLLEFEAFKHACVFAASGHWRDFAGASAHEELKDPAPNSVP